MFKKRIVLMYSLILVLLLIMSINSNITYAEQKELVSNGDITQSLSDAEPAADGTIDTAGSWAYYQGDDGAGSAVIEDGTVKINVSQNGSGYSVQLLQGPLTLTKGSKYKVQFKAKADTEIPLTLKVGGVGDVAWRAYVQEDKNLTTEWATYEATFTMTQETNDNARFEFWLLNPGTYYIDDISLVKTGEVELLEEGILTEVDEDAVESWELVWEDNFDGTSIDSSAWTFELGSPDWNGDGNPDRWGNNELQYYQQDNASVSDGILTITAKEEQVKDMGTTFDYTSTRMITKDKYEVQYGRMEIRAKLPIGQGIWPAIWMLGNDIDENPWPNCGEIDIMEYLGHKPSVVHGTIHGPESAGAGVGSGYTLETGQFNEEFHVFTIEWDADEIEFYVDEQLYHVANKDEIGASDWVFDHPYFFIFNVAVGGNWPGNPDETTSFPQEMQIDYIKVYEDTNPDSIDGQEVWDSEYEERWVEREDANLDDYYFLSEYPALVDITIDWDNTVNDGDISVDEWGTGTVLNDSVIYNGKSTWELTGAPVWGASNVTLLALMGDLYDGGQAEFPVEVTDYNSIEITLASSGGFDDLKMKLAGPELEISIADYVDLTSTDWQTISVPLSEFGSIDVDSVTQIALFGWGGAAGEKLYVADFYLK